MRTAQPASAFSAADDFPLGAEEFAAIARMVHAHAGIVLADGKKQLVYSRLVKLIRRQNLSGFPELARKMRDDAEVRREAIFALTTNHTKFFREDHHFTHFRSAVRPGLVAKAERGQPVRLWSSASSSGEEPYTLAMHMLGEDRAAAARIAGRDVAILATDLAPHVLATAREGRYPADAARDIPEHFRKLWTRPDGNGIVMAPELKALIAYRQLNLLDEWPIKVRFDVIFCRNVMIYFDEPTKGRLIERFAERLAPGNLPYTGHSERVTGPAAHAFEAIGQTIYRKR